MINIQEVTRILQINGLDKNSSLEKVNDILTQLQYSEADKQEVIGVLKGQGWFSVADNILSPEKLVMPPTQSVEPTNKSSKKAIIGIVILVIFIISVLGFGYYFLSQDKQDVVTQTNKAPSESEILVKGLLAKNIIPTEISTGSQTTVVKLDGYPGGVFLGENQLRFSPDFKHVAYRVKNGENTDVYLDGVLIPIKNEKGLPYEVNYDLFFSSNSKHFSFLVIWKNGGNKPEYKFYFDGVPSKAYEYISDINFSPDGERYAYRASTNRENFVVLDGKEQPKYSWVGEYMIFGSDSKRFAYLVDMGNENNYFVVDGVKETYLVNRVFENYFAFSPDSQHYAYISYKNNNGEDPYSYQIILDNKFKEFVLGSNNMVSRLQVAPDGKTVSYWVTRHEVGQYLIVNGKEFGPYDQLSIPSPADDVAYSSDSGHYAFRALLKIENYTSGLAPKNSIVVIKDGNVFGNYDSLVDLSFNNNSDLLVQPIKPQNKSLIYTEKDTNGNIKYYLIINGVKSSHYDKLYGPISVDDKKISFWSDQKGQISLVLFDIAGDTNSGETLTESGNKAPSIKLSNPKTTTPVLPTPITTCTDTDANATYPSGLNYFTKGETSFKFPDGMVGVSTDGCFDDKNGSSNAPIECVGADSFHGNGKCVNESYCPSSTQSGGLIKSCPNGCSDGACI